MTGIQKKNKLAVALSSIWNYFKGMMTDNLIAAISSIRNRTNKFLINELRKEGLVNIVPSHGFILYALFKNDGISMKDITERIGKKKNTVTVLVDKLVTLGLVNKKVDQSDRRTSRIFLTPKGKALEKPFNKISEELITTAYTGFTEKEKYELSLLLSRIHKNFEQ